MSESASQLQAKGSVLDASCVFQHSYNLDNNNNNMRLYSTATAHGTVVFMEKVTGGQPQLNGCKGNTTSQSDNGL